jgi:hypothetical protein
MFKHVYEVENDLLGVVLAHISKLRVPNLECPKKIAWTYGIGLALYEKLFDNLLVLAGNVTKTCVLRVKQVLGEWGNVS